MIAFVENKLYGWHLPLGKVDFRQALSWQRGLVKMRREGFARDTIITVEHPPVITVGRDGHEENYRNCKVEPVFIERGGDVTYHGPGQLVAYFIFNLTRRGRDVHQFMSDVQEGIIKFLADYDITARKDEEHTGVWVADRKIASVGVAIKKWISFHGIALNINTNLEEFTEINPCGLTAETMTSTEKLLGRRLDLAECARQLVARYSEVFETEFAPIDLAALAEDVESQAGGYEV
jgi:lipoate-protein ligase B